MKQEKHILLIEDDPVTAKIISKRMGGHDYNITWLKQGEEALDLVQICDGSYERCPFHLVLMDLDLGPGLDGVDTAQQILQRTHLPIIFVSSHTEGELVHKTRSIPHYGYVVKNTGEFVLVQAIERALELFYCSQRQLQASEERFQALLDKLQDSYYRTDLDGNIQLVNQKALELFGYNSQHEVTGLNLARSFYVDPTEREVFVERLLQNGHVHNFEAQLKKRTGEVISVLASSTLIYDDQGRPEAIEGIVRDITERQKRRLEIQRLSSYVTQAQEPMMETDLHGRIRYINPATSRTFGYSLSELKGHLPHILLAQKAPARYVETIKAFLAHKDCFKARIQCRRKDGTRLWCQLKISPLQDQQAQTYGYLAMLRDTTKQKETEDKLRQKDKEKLTILNNLKDTIVEYIDQEMNLIWAGSNISDFYKKKFTPPVKKFLY